MALTCNLVFAITIDVINLISLIGLNITSWVINADKMFNLYMIRLDVGILLIVHIPVFYFNITSMYDHKLKALFMLVKFFSFPGAFPLPINSSEGHIEGLMIWGMIQIFIAWLAVAANGCLLKGRDSAKQVMNPMNNPLYNNQVYYPPGTVNYGYPNQYPIQYQNGQPGMNGNIQPMTNVNTPTTTTVNSDFQKPTVTNPPAPALGD